MDRNEALRQQAEFYADASDQWVRGDTDKAERFEKAAEIADQLAALLEGVGRVRELWERRRRMPTDAFHQTDPDLEHRGEYRMLEKVIAILGAAQGAEPAPRCEDCQPDPVTAKCRTCGVPIKPDADNQIHCARCAPFHTPPPDGVTLMQSTGSPKRTSPVTVTTDPPDTHGQWIGSNDGGGR